MRALGRKVPVGRLLPIRIATEALHLTAPAGFVVADSATAALLDARCGVPVAEGAVLAIARKWLVTRSHAAYIVLGAVCGAGALGRRVLARARRSLAGVGGGRLGARAAVDLDGARRGVPRSARDRRPAERPRQAPLAGGPRAGLAVAPRRRPVDGHLARIGAAATATRLATLTYFGSWLVEAFETALILRLVGGPLDLRLALAAEVGVSLVRSVGNVAPAGLGVQDAGYAVLFEALGVPAPTTAAFVLLKRGKELVWIATGYAILAAMRRPMAGVDSARVAGGVARSAPMGPIFGDAGGPAPSQPAV